MIELLGETEKQRWRSFVKRVYEKNLNEGPDATQNEFMKSLVNVPFNPYPADLNERLSGNVDFFFRHELRGLCGYLPMIDSIMNSKVNMVTAVGANSNDAYYVYATRH